MTDADRLFFAVSQFAELTREAFDLSGIASKYTDANSIADYKEFAGRSYFLCGDEGWKEIATYMLNWVEKVA